MIAPRHEIAFLQSDFYRDQFRKVLRWLMYSILINMIMILTIIYFVLAQPPRVYYANTTEGKILPMPGVN